MSFRFARWRSVYAVLLLGLAGLSSAPAQGQAPALKPLDPPQPVRVAYVPIMKFATAYVAESRGLFKKYGLDVKLDSVKSGTEAIAFLDKGSVDVGGIAIVASLWSAWNRGLDIRVIAPGALDPMVKEMLYLAASAAAGCTYCIASHTAAARARGMTAEMHGELLAVLGMAAETNRLAETLRVPVDEAFR